MKKYLSLCLTALGLSASGAANAQSVPIGKAPPAWVAYAGIVSDDVSDRMRGPAPEAVRVRNYMLETAVTANAPEANLPIALWIDPAGTITQIRFTPFAHADANADLNTLLIGYKLKSPPPKGMLLPMRIGFTVKPDPAAATAAPAQP